MKFLSLKLFILSLVALPCMVRGGIVYNVKKLLADVRKLVIVQKNKEMNQDKNRIKYSK